MHKIGGIIIKDKELLVARSRGKEFFIAPGGKVEPGETPEESLIRELNEEVQITVQKNQLNLFGTFYAPAAGNESVMLRMDVFIVESWQGEISPTREVEEIKWIDSSSLGQIKIGSIFEHEVIPKLKLQKLIK